MFLEMIQKPSIILKSNFLQAQIGAIVEKKQGTAKTYFNTSDMRLIAKMKKH